MSQWRCQKCRAILSVENDHDLMFVALDHSCQTPVSRWQTLGWWLIQRGKMALAATSSGSDT